jgi:PKD repeat protein
MKATATATVVATGVLTVSVSAPSKGYKGVAISISASWDGGAVGPFTGQINWGDGAYDPISTSSKSISKSHTYAAAGTYTIQVIVADSYTAADGQGTASVQIANLLTATLSPSPSMGPIPLPVTFTLGVSNGFAPYTYVLSFGDGTSDASGGKSDPGTMSLSHTYTKVGNFTATLTFTDALGASVVSRSKLSIGMEGVAAQPWAAVLAPLVAGVVLVTVARRF